MKRPPPPDPVRRKLLGTARHVATAGVAATLLPSTGASSAVAASPETAARPAHPRGYHESEHTRNYYRLARY